MVTASHNLQKAYNGYKTWKEDHKFLMIQQIKLFHIDKIEKFEDVKQVRILPIKKRVELLKNILMIPIKRKIIKGSSKFAL